MENFIESFCEIRDGHASTQRIIELIKLVHLK
ncbi:MAG: hypothetical protein QOI12_25 [Alphaproteobacteria bacterium]|jgi:hypothetical protein|nr:hypothetical protein [Alphaproteobacteria bacterium]